MSINLLSHGIDVKIHVPPQLRILQMILLMVKQIVNHSGSDSYDQAISIFFLFIIVNSFGALSLKSLQQGQLKVTMLVMMLRLMRVLKM